MTTSARRQAVFDAAEELASRGIKPTLESIRDITGGSYSTLGPLLKEWRDQEEAKRSSAPPIPTDITNLAASFAGQLWIAAMKESEAKFKGERELLEAKEAALRIEYQDLLEAADKHVSSIAALTESESAHRAQVEKLEASLAEIQERMQEAQSQISSLQEMYDQERASTEAAKEQLARLGEQESKFSMERETLNSRIAHLEGQLLQLGAQNERLMKAIPGATS